MSHDPTIREHYELSKEPTGFANRTDSTLSFDDASRTLTIAPVGAKYDVFLRGVLHQKTASQSTTITDTEGLWYFYFDETGALQNTQTMSSAIITDYAFIAILYWDADNDTAIYVGDERHGFVMDGVTHSYLHNSVGAAFVTGFALGDFNISDGDLDVDAQFSVTGGVFFDEDIRHTVVDGSPQTLSPAASLPVLYRVGATGNWRKKTANAFPVITRVEAGDEGEGIVYNFWTGTDWTLQSVSDNSFMLIHVFATNSLSEPIIAVLGIEAYGNVPAARAAAPNEIAQLSGLPFAEIIPIGSVIYQSASGYDNAVSARVRLTDTGENYVDLREISTLPVNQVNDHGNLSGLADLDHPADAIRVDATAFHTNLSASDTTVQAALETLDNLTVTGGVTSVGVNMGDLGLQVSTDDGVTFGQSGTITSSGTFRFGGNPLVAHAGGTGLSSYVAGDILYANGTTSLTTLGAQASGRVLLSGTAPSWGALPLGTHVSGQLPIANGGTGQATASAAFGALSPLTTKGDILAYNSVTPANVRFPVGSNGQVLTADSTVAGVGLKWATPTTGTVTSVTGSGGTTGLTLSGGPITGVGTLTLGGTLVVANGGTGVQTLAAGALVVGNGTSAVSTVADVPTGNALLSGGVGANPAYGKIGLTTHVSGVLPAAYGGTGASTAFTAGSLVFAGASGVYAQDNDNLYWDDTTNRLAVGVTPTYTGTLTIGSTTFALTTSAACNVQVSPDISLLPTNTITTDLDSSSMVIMRYSSAVTGTALASALQATAAIITATVTSGNGGVNLTTSSGIYQTTTTRPLSSTLNVGTAAQFQVNSTGDIVAIRGQTTTFPSSNASGVLTNNGSGTLSWGAVGVTNGGTGLTSAALGDLLYASAANTYAALSITGSNNRVLRSNGSTPSWSQVALTTDVTGTLPVGNGGTGAITLTGYVKGNGTGAFTASGTVPGSDVSGTVSVANGGTGAAAFTQGSVVFAGASGVYTQNNTNFFWDNTGNALRLGSATNPDSARLVVSGGLTHVSTQFNARPSLSESNYEWVNRTGAGHTWYVNAASLQAMTLTSAGKLGIGTTGPSKKLDVANDDALIYGLTVGRGPGGLVTNTVFGSNALVANTNVGPGTTAIGFEALKSFTGLTAPAGAVDSSNTAVGANAAATMATGVKNTALGFAALGLSTSSSDNTALGFSALQNATGTGNVAVGSTAGATLTSGTSNVVVGAGAVATTGAAQNVVVGATAGSSLQSMRSVAVGRNANTGASDNTVIGFEANLNGSNAGNTNNVAIGSGAARSMTAGTENTVMGYYAGYLLDTGAYNVFVGSQAGYNAATGDSNVVVGAAAFPSGTSDDNVAIGANSLAGSVSSGGHVAVGRYALNSCGLGAKNTAVGYSALQATSTGSYNTALGYSAARASEHENSVAIGFKAADGGGGSRNVSIGSLARAQSTATDDGVFIGYEAGGATTSTSTGIVAIGSGALRSYPGSETTAVGYQALYSNSAGTQNTALGYQALFTNTNGRKNTAIGLKALRALATGTLTESTENTAVGFFAGTTLTTGQLNTAVGSLALYAGTTAQRTTALGASALANGSSCLDGVFIGAYSGNNVTTANRTVAIGAYALGQTGASAAVTGQDNIAIGYQAMASSSGGDNGNIAIGSASLSAANTSTVSYNIAIGVSAISSLTDALSSDNNVAIGATAMQFATSGSGNVALGYSAASDAFTGSNGVAIGNNACYGTGAAVNGGENIAIGYNAGQALTGYAVALTTGFQNTFIGRYAGTSVADADNCVSIGNLAYCNASNQITLGNASTTTFRIGAASTTAPNPGFSITGLGSRAEVNIGHTSNSFSAPFISFFVGGLNGSGAAITQGSSGGFGVLYTSGSDYRLKTDVVTLDTADALTRITKLRPIKYRYIANPDGPLVDGFIAHEAQEQVPQAVTHEKDALKEDGTPLYQGIDHSQLIPVLTAACKELAAQNQRLEARLAALESALAAR